MDIKTEYDGYDVWVKITHFEPEVPAYTSGLPEDCYPAEGGIIEFEVEGWEALCAPEDRDCDTESLFESEDFNNHVYKEYTNAE